MIYKLAIIIILLNMISCKKNCNYKHKLSLDSDPRCDKFYDEAFEQCGFRDEAKGECLKIHEESDKKCWAIRGIKPENINMDGC